jgi:hypothetical protein
MTPLATKSRQPLSSEWRRHSLVRVRRPAWAGHGSTGATQVVSSAQVTSTAPPLTSSQTTYDDISW